MSEGRAQEGAKSGEEGRLKINSVYLYRLKADPSKWLGMIAPGCDIDQARAALQNVYLDRFLEVVSYEPE